MIFFDNYKKIKWNKKKTCKNRTVNLLLFSFITLATFDTIFYHNIVLRYIPNLDVAVRSWDLPSLMMAIFEVAFDQSNSAK